MQAPVSWLRPGRGNGSAAFAPEQGAEMTTQLYPTPSSALNEARKRLAPDALAAFQAFSRTVFTDGALPARTKQIIAVAVAHVTQCPYCIDGHTKAALRAGARPEELMEAIWVAAEMRAGAAYAHSAITLAAIEERSKREQAAETAT
jgi:AhpD family alkylhydroperoxidase